MNTEFAQNIQADIQSKIGDGPFWVMNRKLRNNIHYQRTEVLTENEIDTLDKFQTVYFEIISSHFQKTLSLILIKSVKR